MNIFKVSAVEEHITNQDEVDAVKAKVDSGEITAKEASLMNVVPQIWLSVRTKEWFLFERSYLLDITALAAAGSTDELRFISTKTKQPVDFGKRVFGKDLRVTILKAVSSFSLNKLLEAQKKAALVKLKQEAEGILSQVQGDSELTNDEKLRLREQLLNGLAASGQVEMAEELAAKFPFSAETNAIINDNTVGGAEVVSFNAAKAKKKEADITIDV